MAASSKRPDAIAMPLNNDECGNAVHIDTGTHKWSTWKWELVAAATAIVSFAGLIAALRSFDGRIYQDWSYHYFTRNTVIAAIATITQTSLLAAVVVALTQNKWEWFSNTRMSDARPIRDLDAFDEASRGLSGCFQLLGVTRLRHYATLGSLVVILSIGFDTFAQNVMGVRSIVSWHTGPGATGEVLRSEIYNASVDTTDWFGVDITLRMKAALSSGIFGGIPPTLGPTCRTANCTWPIVPTIATCGACTDMTGYLEQNCSFAYCDYSLPDGAYLTSMKQGLEVSEWGASSWLPLFNVTVSRGYAFNNQMQLNRSSRIYAAQFSVIHFEKGFNGDYSDTLGDVKAEECAIWFCLKAYNVSIDSGKFRQDTVQVWAEASPDEDLSHGVGVETRHFVRVPEIFAAGENVTYGAKVAVAKAVNATLQSTLNSDPRDGVVSWSGHYGAYQYFSDRTQSLWNSRRNLSGWTENVAESLTAIIRQDGAMADPDQSSGLFSGRAQIVQDIVFVRWVWIVYPLIILVGGLTHFAVTVWQSSSGRVWKGIPSIALLLKLEDDDGHVERLGLDGFVNENVQNRRVHLLADEEQKWVFRSY